jgi:hypothetical protein
VEPDGGKRRILGVEEMPVVETGCFGLVEEANAGGAMLPVSGLVT